MAKRPPTIPDSELDVIKVLWDQGQGTVREILECDLKLEQQASAHLREAVAHAESVRDFVTRDLFSEMLEGEEEQVDFIETQLDLRPSVGHDQPMKALTTRTADAGAKTAVTMTDAGGAAPRSRARDRWRATRAR